MTENANLTSQVERYLPQQIQGILSTIGKEANTWGKRLYLVGGFVRDLLLNHHSLDLDLVIEGDAISLAKNIALITKADLLIHPHFGTAKLGYSNFTLDIATARSETYARPGALPTVNPATLSTDLSRRDFSINAMAISLNCDDYGKLIDPCGGKNDLDKHLIRVLHPDSFREDATRILRAFRYQQRLDFVFETQTEELIRRDISMLDTISGDRLRNELELILREEYPEKILKQLEGIGILKKLNSSLSFGEEAYKEFKKARSYNSADKLYSLYLCLLIYPLSYSEIKQFIQRLNVPLVLARAMKDTIKLKSKLHLLTAHSIRHSEIFFLLNEYDLLAIYANDITSKLPAVHSNIDLFLNRLRNIEPSINGEELINLGIPAGPVLGKILKAVHRAKLDGEVSSKEEELRLALSFKTLK
jgi:tRNA nucleotidyltransferase (CCA-adding enzyme)